MGALFGTIGADRDPSVVHAMAQRLAHRGAGTAAPQVVGGAVLGGCGEEVQPVRYGRLTAVWDMDLFDGETLARALAEEGVVVDPKRPDEVLLGAWRMWGPQALARLNADFALAVHDADDDSVVLARDRTGARPLYYAAFAGGLAFASEYKALVLLPGVAREVDRVALQYLQSCKAVPPGRTLLRAVQQLPPATWMRVRAGRVVARETFWQPASDIRAWSYDTHREAVKNAFLRAVERRLPERGPVAVALSGGVDSIAVAGAVRKLRPDAPLAAFTIGDDGQDPELAWAARVAKRFAAEHHALVFAPETMAADLRALVWHLEDPIARTETLLTYQLCRHAQGHAAWLLRGDGADGLFGGMARHRILALADRMAARDLWQIYAFTQTGVPPVRPLARLCARAAFGDGPAPPRVQGAPPPEAPAFPEGEEGGLLARVLADGPRHALPMLLQKAERAHAAFELRAVSPFTDPEVIEAALRVPSRYKVRGRQNKIILRDAMRDFLPPELAARPKFPQRIRETRHFCDALDAAARPLLAPERIEARGLFDPTEVARLVRRPKDGVWPPEHAMRIWTLALCELWAQLFLDAPAGTEPAATRLAEPEPATSR